MRLVTAAEEKLNWSQIGRVRSERCSLGAGALCGWTLEEPYWDEREREEALSSTELLSPRRSDREEGE